MGKHKSPLYVVTEVTAPDGIHTRRRSTTASAEPVTFTVAGNGRLLHIDVDVQAHETVVTLYTYKGTWRQFAASDAVDVEGITNTLRLLPLVEGGGA